MALQFVLGSSGSGKSEYLYEKVIKDAAEHPEFNYLFVVPEQFTMAIQKELVKRQPSHAILNIDVLSFQRMAFRVFDELGKNDVVILEETGKNLVLRKIAQKEEENLTVLKGNIKKLGYISEIKSLISELMQYNIAPSDIERILEGVQDNEPFVRKMRDVECMYQGFLDYLEGTYITSEEVLDLLAQLADRSQMLKNSVLILDGFTGFTPIQNTLLERLFPILQDVIVSLCIDEKEDFYSEPRMEELFYMSKKTIRQLQKIAQETRTEIRNPVVLGGGEQKRFRQADALYFLEQNLFRRRFRQYPNLTEQVQLISLKDPKSELEYVAQKISHLVREQKMRYRDFAVVTGDLEQYGNYAEEVFEGYDIPVFLDSKQTILFHPLIECIRAVLEIVEQDFSYESIFRYLKTGLCDVTAEECDDLENYVLALGIRGKKRWSQKWVKVPYQWDEKAVEKPEQIRAGIMGYLTPLIEVFQKKGSTVREWTTALYLFLKDHAMAKKMQTYCQAFEEQGDLARAKQYEQIYGIVMDLFDKVVDLLGDEILTLEEYREILDAGFEAAKVGVIPPGYDRVTIGDIQRTRLDQVQMLFFIGVNDGIIPKMDDGGGILSEMERQRLAQKDIELAPSGREKVFIQKNYLYLNLTKPSRALYVTYAQVDAEGKAKRPSYLIGTLKKLFPKIAVQEESVDTLRAVVTPKSSLRYYINGLQKKDTAAQDAAFCALDAWYQSQDAWREKSAELKDAAFFSHQKERLTHKTAQALYGLVLENSVTRLEQFASCAYAHFLTYGLKLSERQLCEFAPVDMGNIFHSTLEFYSQKLQKGGYSWFDIDEETSQRLLKEAFEEALALYHGEALYDNAENAYMANRMKRILDRTVWALQKQVQSGTFEPENYEVSFAFAEDLDTVNLTLGEEEKMRLRGRIDRVDTVEIEGRLYVKIIDYKSGNTKFELASLYYGMQLQLLVYLNAAMELMKKKYPDKEIHPAGIFYYHLDDPLVDETEPMTQEEIWQELLKALKPDGIVNSKEEVYRAMDKELSGASNVIPVGVTKSGALSKSSKVVSEEEFQAMSRFVQYKMKELGERIVQGEVDADPYCLNTKDSCSYCPYTGICGFDEKLPGFEKRKLAEIAPNEAIIEKMREEMGEIAVQEKKEEDDGDSVE
ncbi:MAG: helicase-exonuclease AddAB subunit AddB [Lachnospiraceae bacterium]